MALSPCPECGRSVSSKAKTCPQCGFPVKGNPLLEGAANAAVRIIGTVDDHLRDPVSNVDIGKFLSDVEPLPKGFKAGTTVNGIGTSVGGHIEISGIPELSIVRKYFCFAFLPVIPMGLYVVKDWNGSGGKFLGRISSENAAKYINLKKQGIATVAGGLIKLAVFALIILAMIWLVHSAKK